MIKVRYLTCSHLLMYRGMEDLKKPHYRSHTSKFQLMHFQIQSEYSRIIECQSHLKLYVAPVIHVVSNKQIFLNTFNIEEHC